MKKYRKKNLVTGLWIEYDNEGDLSEKGQLVNGKKEGLWIYNNGNSIIKGRFKKGVKYGYWYEYNKISRTMKVRHCKNLRFYIN